MIKYKIPYPSATERHARNKEITQQCQDTNSWHDKGRTKWYDIPSNQTGGRGTTFLYVVEGFERFFTTEELERKEHV